MQNDLLFEKVKIEAHLNKCPFCLKEFVKTKKLFELLSRNEIPKPTEDFWRNFNTELKAKIASATEKEAPRFVLRPIRSFTPTFSFRPAFSLALALVLIFVVSILFVDRFGQKPIELAKTKTETHQAPAINAESKETAVSPIPIILAQANQEELLTDNSVDGLLEELYILDELSQDQESESLEAEDITNEEEIEASDLPYLYELDPQLAEELEVG